MDVPFIDGLPSGYLCQFAMEKSTMLLIGKPSINGPFSMAMAQITRWYIYI